jgi:hypothetical protein
MAEVRILSEENGVRTVTDGKETWKEYPSPKRGPVKWFEQEVLFHPDKWYTKTLSFLFHWLVLLPLTIPIYQAALIYFVSPWVGLGGWTWWQIVIKLIVLAILWLPVIFLNIWAAQNAVGENGIDADD